ncbi:class I SAM-dependent methyltransferase [Natrialbaceae archaeon A-CW2]|uniref:class I SAM-dependent methyltransferase n=1 Tax=Natronosalvus amylolyticus TaxID=2961994 RepID=UPI0020C9ACC8|nr:methyltransferase domain-containing protein [Natronosalvus amylolyticus]
MGGFHTFPVERADALEDPSRYRYCSREELISMLDIEGQDGPTVADLGSGTGFYTDDVAPFTGTCYAVDVQSAMHDAYREKGLPENVECVTSGIDSLPFPDDHLDGAFSTMTYHEFSDPAIRSFEGTTDSFHDEALAELARVIRPGGRLVTVDWSADGQGEDGPSVDERFSISDVRRGLESAGFEVIREDDRPETLAIVAICPE